MKLAQRREFSAWCYNPSQKPMAKRVAGPRVEPAFVISIRSHVVKLDSEQLSLYLYTQAEFNLGNRSFFLL